MDQAEAAHQLGREVAFLAAEGGATGEGNPLRAIDGVAGRVRRDEGGVARVLDALGDLVEHLVPGDLLPVVGARGAVHRVLDPPGAGCELHRGGALGAEPALVDRAVRVALDLDDPLRAIGILLRKGDERAADRAVGTNRMGLLGAGDVEALLDPGRLRQIESEGAESGRTRPGGPDFQKVAARDLWHSVPPMERVGRRLRHSLPISHGAVNQICPLPLWGRAGWGRGTVGLDMNDWFEALARRFTDAAQERGAKIVTPELDPQVADEILELARVAAHTKERRFAPLACFMAGVAVERVRQAGALSEAEEAAYIRTITLALEAAPGEGPETSRSA